MKFYRVVFCDFDGTITSRDTFVSMLEKFAPEIAAKQLPTMFRREISLKQGIHQTLGQFVPHIIQKLSNTWLISQYAQV